MGFKGITEPPTFEPEPLSQEEKVKFIAQAKIDVPL
jgi:hypothetical protein